MRRLILIALLAAGCGAPPVLPLRLPAGAHPSYEDSLKGWTRKGESYEHFESRIFARATYFSPAFAAAYATQRSKRMGLTVVEATTQKETLLARSETETRFFVAVITNDEYWNDLDRGQRATFRTRLIARGNAITPQKIERISNDTMADLRVFFPYAGPLTRGYWITFPNPPDPHRLQLRIAGAPAYVDLVWKSQK